MRSRVSKPKIVRGGMEGVEGKKGARARQRDWVSTGLEVFHEDGDDDVDEDELGDEHEDDEVDGSDERVHATVVAAVVRVVAVVTQRVLHRHQHVLLHRPPFVTYAGRVSR